MNRPLLIALLATLALPMAACSGGKGRVAGDLAASKVTTIGVNSYLWRASLDTLSFMPMAQTDSNGGVIVTDWYVNPARQRSAPSRPATTPGPPWSASYSCQSPQPAWGPARPLSRRRICADDRVDSTGTQFRDMWDQKLAENMAVTTPMGIGKAMTEFLAKANKVTEADTVNSTQAAPQSAVNPSEGKSG